MKFGIPQLLRFHAVQGAYSPITSRELYDSQLTATDAETELFVSHFSRMGESIHVGNVNGNPAAAKKSFRLFPSGETIWLNLVYPKPLKSELRLYLSKQRGFFPNEGDIWFIFVNKANELWIGSLPEKEWRALCAGVENPEPASALAEPASVPAEPSSAPSEPASAPAEDDTKTEDQDPCPIQDPALIRKRMELSKYSCEYNPTHKLFVARATGSRYVEVHHIIPKKYQPAFWSGPHKDLTKLDNLCSLCPWCHRAIHHGEESLSRAILSSLFDLRSLGFHYGITKEQLYQLYSVEEIVREDSF